MVDLQGRLIGIGSLFVQEVTDEQPVQGNMFVPIDLLEPILENLSTIGVSGVPPRPWLGLYTTEAPGLLVVNGLAPGSPAEQAGVKTGDLIIEVRSKRVAKLADMLRNIWDLGAAGVTVPLTLMRDGALKHVEIKSANRSDFLKKRRLH
jgi:S1-C subfamily serine protease